jgi:hypothetical protein
VPKIIVKPDVPNRAPTLYFIVGIKIFKGVLRCCWRWRCGFSWWPDKDLPDMFDRFLRFVHVDPEKSFFGHRRPLDTVTPGNVQAVAGDDALRAVHACRRFTAWRCARSGPSGWRSANRRFSSPIEIFELVRRRPPIRRIIRTCSAS